jgi:hypothetical protein
MLSNRRKIRKIGHQMVEFSAAIVVLVICVLIPIIDLSVLPLRLLLWQEALNSDVRKLAQSEKFSSAKESLDTDKSLLIYTNRIDGIRLLGANSVLTISKQTPPYETFATDEINSIPPKWLPTGIKAPCTYELQVSTTVEVSPLIMFNGFKTPIPGLTAPFIFTNKARNHWENSSRDPVTGMFFMNE